MRTQFKGMIHSLHKCMGSISYPITKEEIINQVGSKQVKVDYDKKVSLEEIIQPIQREKFDCAAQFYCALLGSL